MLLTRPRGGRKALARARSFVKNSSLCATGDQKFQGPNPISLLIAPASSSPCYANNAATLISSPGTSVGATKPTVSRSHSA
jgi:hypothetical protein